MEKAMKFILKIYEKNREIINYIIVGGLTTIVSLAVYYGCVLTFLDPERMLQLQTANILSWIAAVNFAYFANRKYVFESKTDNKLFELLTFYLSRLSTLILDMFCMFLLVTVMGINDKISKLLVQVIITVANYVLSKFIVFKK